MVQCLHFKIRVLSHPADGRPWQCVFAVGSFGDPALKMFAKTRNDIHQLHYCSIHVFGYVAKVYDNLKYRVESLKNIWPHTRFCTIIIPRCMFGFLFYAYIPTLATPKLSFHQFYVNEHKRKLSRNKTRTNRTPPPHDNSCVDSYWIPSQNK